MSLKGYAVMAAIGFHNQRSPTAGNANRTTSTLTTAVTVGTPTKPTTWATTYSSTSLSPLPAPAANTNVSNTSMLLQLQQPPHTDIVMTKIATTAQSTLATPIKTTSSRETLTQSSSLPSIAPIAQPLNPYSRSSSSSKTDHFEDQHLHHHRQHLHSSAGTSGTGRNIYSDSEEEEEDVDDEGDDGPVDGNGGGIGVVGDGRPRPVNTFYGSGFGIFHQQRSNMGGAGGGGGIALITGNSGSGLGSSSYSIGINNNVNLLLGGAMLTLITTILCVVCYCCHRNIKKRTEAAYRQQRQWLENDPNMEIYSVEQCYETSGLFVGDSMDGLATIPALHHEPPPSYDAVVAMQEQQQLLIQQQQQQQQLLLMQQLQNNSPPPGYRSSLDVSCMLTARATGLTSAVLGMGSTDTNSLAASSSNVRDSLSCTPTDSNDMNGNRDAVASATASTSASTQLQQPLHKQLHQSSFLRAAKQRQRNLPAANLSNYNMKKVLQAQSCCSLQRAEVENMWNAAAAALAARANHVAADARGTASTSSPTLAMNSRKLSNAHSSKTNTPETFGSRYLKQQNYYRRGCPLCGKFRYDNESNLSISIESDLDNMATIGNGSGGDANGDEGHRNEDEDRGGQQDDSVNCDMETGGDIAAGDEGEADDDECSCLSTQRRRQLLPLTVRHCENTTPALVAPHGSSDLHHTTGNREDIELTCVRDLNANASPATSNQPSTSSLTHNNNNSTHSNSNSNNNNELASDTTTVKPSTSSTSANSVTIDLDCINENGIISLDMSKIIDKTGLPTYDAALKLESSGYV